LREQDHIANGSLVGKQHDQAVDPDPQPTGGRHPIFQCHQEVFIDLFRLSDKLFLLHETLTLNGGIVQF